MSEHTPGPWAIEYPMGDDLHVIVQANKPTYEWSFIATITGDPEDGRKRISKAEAKANAMLIKAAPQMLAALERAERWIEQGGTPSPLDEIHDAIASATREDMKHGRWWEDGMTLKEHLEQLGHPTPAALRKRYTRLMAAFTELQTAAQFVVSETDRIHDNDPWPIKYRAPYDAITKLRLLLASQYGVRSPQPPSASDDRRERAGEER